MGHSNSQFTLFCLALMLATLGFALYRINSAKKTGDQIPEQSANWAILSAFVVCGLAFMQVALDGRAPVKKEQAYNATETVHKVANVVELGKSE